MLTHFFCQRMKAALWYHIGKIVDEETFKLGVNATPQFIAGLTEIVWAQIGMSLISQIQMPCSIFSPCPRRLKIASAPRSAL